MIFVWFLSLLLNTIRLVLSLEQQAWTNCASRVDWARSGTRKLWDGHILLCKKGKLLYEIGFSGIGKTLKISVNSKCYREHQGICSISIMSKLIYLLIEYIYSWIVNHLSVKHPWINAWPPQTSMIELLQK